ncbi:uncharacterized protein F4822DRAFT_150820 [Hypoxylon trugodes]|uniref:uncharacterized protein n=1 Tax=Hypoxylon trugodes TaxID=326681 RepID=UPI00219D2F1D|nr:uncharacterized protein F4822DRAFT_150820 [Hypoxylon trugodes]KAI1382534.1 hypothetical protein F4822DRAFT_150820 [Hypoxylon trugodes]
MAKRKAPGRHSHTGVESPSSIADTIHVSPSTPPTLMALMSKPSRRSTRITPTDDMTGQNSASPKLGVCTLTDASSERDVLPSSNESSLPASSQTPSRKRPRADSNTAERPKRPRRPSDEEGTDNVKEDQPTLVQGLRAIVDLATQDEETESQPSCILEWPNLNEQDLDRLNGHASASSDRKLNDAVVHACLEGLACLQPYIFTIAPWEVQSIISTSHETQSFPNHHRAFLGATEGLFCPNIAGNHWVCVHLELQKCQATIYNSLGDNDTQRDEATRIIKILIQHLIEGGEAFAQWKFVARNCPTQANAYDCGIYALATAYHLAYRLAIPDEFDAQLWRCFLYAFLMGRSPEPSVGISTIERVMDWHILRTDITELSDDPHVLYSQIPSTGGPL